MRTIYLHGQLAQQFVPEIKLNVANAAEAVLALATNFGNTFTEIIRKGSYRVTVGKINAQREIDEEQLNFGVPNNGEIHFYPVVRGAGRSGIGKVILGTLLLAGAFIFAPAAGLGATAFSVFGSSVTFGHLALFGAGIALSGVSQLLTPTPETPAEVEENPSFIYTGPTNTIAEGAPVPLVYGRIRTGALVVNVYTTTGGPANLRRGGGGGGGGGDDDFNDDILFGDDELYYGY